MKPLIIFHSINGMMHCDDGFCAAWVAWKRFNGDADFHPGIYGQEPPNCTGQHVHMLDFSYKRPEMLKIGREAASLVVLDHHKTAHAELAGLDEEIMSDGRQKDGFGQPLNAPYIRFNMNHSGANLAWQYFFDAAGFGPPPDLLRYIEDADLWRWSYPDGKAVQAALRSYPQTFEVWSDLMAKPIAELAAEGASIRRFIEAKVRELLPNARWMAIDEYPAMAVNCPPFLASEVAGALAEEGSAPFGVAYYDAERMRVLSLRSRGDFDVSEVARKFGGGGHRNAAGFQVPLP